MINILSKQLLKLRNRDFFIFDTIVFLITPVLALTLRLDSFAVIERYEFDLIKITILFLLVKLSVLYLCGFYKYCWRYASIDELVQLTKLVIAAVIVETLLFFGAHQIIGSPVQDLPRSLPLLDGILSFILIGGFRFSVRAVERASHRHIPPRQRDRVLVVGAGSAGISIVQEMQRSPQLRLYPVAFVDDDPQKLNLRIRGLPVVGSRHKIPEIVDSLNIRKAIIAIPTAPGGVIREILDICKIAGVQTSTLPGIHELLSDRPRIGNLREIQIQDLLRRAPIQMNRRSVSKFLSGKKVLITGAGGSIGSELCRQTLKCRPAEILLVGHGENSVFNIQQELEQILQRLRKNSTGKRPIPRITSLIADIRFPSRLAYAFEQFKPDIVLHAAAHKHVPMMELNSPEAVTNNVLGTKNLLDLALQHDVKNFVMLSTDKAVNPTSIMGASKRVAEMLVLQAAQKSGRPFVTVRFGNVLGSRGSIVPIIRKQIANGGPVTITHPEICRYFMTIPEAVQLVLQASLLGHGGEVFVLNMGQPVKIVDLAKDLIRLSGYEVNKDIEIIFTGLRPGEKLFEELFIAGEQYNQTEHKKILIAQNASGFVPKNLDLAVKALCAAATNNHSASITFLLRQLVPEYVPQGLTADNPANASEANTHPLPAMPPGIEAKQQIVPETGMPDSLISSLEIEKELQRALENQEFQLYYQPIVLLGTSAIAGFEALLRWQHPKWGLVSPVKFISVAEAAGLTIPIGQWVLREACHQMRSWQNHFPTAGAMTISVNLSSRQLAQPNLVGQIDQILQQTGLDACCLRLEITESVIIENSELMTAVVLRLEDLGVQLQIDNFGLGHSSSSHPYCFPNLLYGKLDRLKVDRSIICQINAGSDGLGVFQTMVTLAHDLDKAMTAVGVETAGQLDQLRLLEFESGQGYLFSKPMKCEAVKDLIRAQS